MNNYFLSKIPISENKQVTTDFFRMSIIAKRIAKTVQPGQFININCGNNTFLARPFSIAGITKENIEIIYKVVGKGTKTLSQKKRGDCLASVVGPLGNGYPIPPNNQKFAVPQKIVIVAGGTGIASLLFLTDKLTKCSSYEIIFLFGTKSKSQITKISNLNKLSNCIYKICTEDGSSGFKGTVTNLLSCVIEKEKAKIYAIYSCGPDPMLKTVTNLANRHNLPCYVSLEERMACGVGACRGCVVKTRSGYKSVCKDGPVFNAKEIV